MTRLQHIIATVVTLLIAALALPSCSDDSCYDNGSSLPLATLWMDGSQQTIPGLSIMGIGAPGDSLLADSTSIQEVYLPLRAGASESRFALWRTIVSDETRWVVSDTLTIDYEAIPYFHSAECGAMYNFSISQVRHSHHGIDSVVVLTPLVTNARMPALRIHFTHLNP